MVLPTLDDLWSHIMGSCFHFSHHTECYMISKSPDKDRLMILKGEQVELKTEFDANGPFGAQVFVNEDREIAQSLHPNESEFGVEYPADEEGSYTIRFLVEGPDLGELNDLENLNPEEIEEVSHVDTEWEITVVEEDSLYETDLEQLKRLITDMIALYSLGKLGPSAIRRLRGLIESLDDDKKGEVVSTPEFDVLKAVKVEQNEGDTEGQNVDLTNAVNTEKDDNDG